MAGATTLKSDLANAARQLGLEKAEQDRYPGDDGATTSGDFLNRSAGTTFQYTRTGNSYCLTATSDRSGVPAFYISSTNTTPQEGTCTGHTGPSMGGGGGSITNGDPIQNVTDANCPTDRTMTVDVRDNHTYWVQKLADGKCWMLTNLAYAGGGTNTYGDTKTLAVSCGATYTTACYYIPTGANPTTNPTEPSTATTGTGQYGYFYNWCAAMGGQATAACANATTPVPDTSVSICPAGWRLPTANGGEFSDLNNVINEGSGYSDAGWLTTWLAQRGGSWYEGVYYSQGSQGLYWSSTQDPLGYGNSMNFSSSMFGDAFGSAKTGGGAVRCVAI